jgi:hypothetical protein
MPVVAASPIASSEVTANGTASVIQKTTRQENDSGQSLLGPDRPIGTNSRTEEPTTPMNAPIFWLRPRGGGAGASVRDDPVVVVDIVPAFQTIQR